MMMLNPGSRLGWLFWTIVCLWMGQSNALAQDLTSEERWAAILLSQPGLIHYNIGTSGELRTSFEPGVSRIPPEILLIGTSIRSELELTPEQTKKIEGLLDKHKKVLDGIIGRNSIKLFRTRAEIETERDPVDETAENLKEIFGVFGEIFAVYENGQPQRLREAQIRFLISQVGFSNFLNQTAVRKQLGLSPPADRRSSESVEPRVADQLNKQELELVASALDEWLADLDEHQRTTFDAAWKKLIQRPGGLALLVLQLLPPGTDFDVKFPRGALDDFPEGSFRYLPYETPVNERKATGVRPDLQKFNMMAYMVRSAFAKHQLSLVEFQSDEVMAILKEWGDVRVEVNAKIGEENKLPYQMMPVYSIDSEDVPVGERKVFDWGTRPDLAGEFEDELERRAGAFVRKIDAVLLPHQEAVLEEVAKGFRIRLAGPLADLLHGELGVEMELTPEQKTLIGQKAKEVREKLMRQSCEIFENALNELIKDWPDSDQERLKKALGPPLQHSFIDPNAFAILLRPNLR